MYYILEKREDKGYNMVAKFATRAEADAAMAEFAARNREEDMCDNILQLTDILLMFGGKSMVASYVIAEISLDLPLNGRMLTCAQKEKRKELSSYKLKAMAEENGCEYSYTYEAVQGDADKLAKVEAVLKSYYVDYKAKDGKLYILDAA